MEPVSLCDVYNEYSMVVRICFCFDTMNNNNHRPRSKVSSPHLVGGAIEFSAAFRAIVQDVRARIGREAGLSIARPAVEEVVVATSSNGLNARGSHEIPKVTGVVEEIVARVVITHH